MEDQNNEFKISVAGLRLGMFVSHLDRPWMGTGFSLEGLTVDSAEDISRLQNLCAFVYVDVSRGKSPDLNYVVYEAGGLGPATRNEFELLRAKNWEIQSDFEVELGNAQHGHAQLASGIGDVLNDIREGGKLDLGRLATGVETMIESITRNPAAFPWVMELRRKGEYAYQHALGCSVWAATFGRHLGLELENLRDLALGGLLCDIGKLRLPKELLTRRGRLAPDDIHALRSHVLESRRIVEETPGMSPDVVSMVAHHHERHDGSGYPGGLAGTDIPVFARMIGLVDSYDAMTSVRPYATSRSPHEAVMQLYQNRNSLFQAELVEQFIATSGIYPTGSLVELSNGSVGVVMSVLSLKRLRPRVMLLLDEHKVPLPDFRSLDLSIVTEDEHHRPLNIRSGLPRGAFGIDPAELFLD